MKIHNKFWKKRQTRPSKNGMRLTYYRFVPHFYDTLDEAKVALDSLLEEKLEYYTVFKVDKGEVKFTFLPSDWNGCVHHSYLTGLNIIRAVKTAMTILR